MQVASREGGVDRNAMTVARRGGSIGRLPRGGRGSQQGHVGNPPFDVVVASREGGVDRNAEIYVWGAGSGGVASREGGVDRNSPQRDYDDGLPVASREGGVDRNTPARDGIHTRGGRLPRGGRGSQHSRGCYRAHPPPVASREGGVDRNTLEGATGRTPPRSPPARGAWIATSASGANATSALGSPPARGAWIATPARQCPRPSHRGRLPRGGRGSQPVATLEGLQAYGRRDRPSLPNLQRRLYCALGAEDIRHRRTASPTVLMRRLLSLDYVLEHPDLPWLPTEPEKVGVFETLGIERHLLPSRLYRGASGSTRRYFPLKLPVALDADRPLFVYADPDHDTSKALRSWGAAHRGPRRAGSLRRGGRRRPHGRRARPGRGSPPPLGQTLRPRQTRR